jgi:hypothetical protein
MNKKISLDSKIPTPAIIDSSKYSANGWVSINGNFYSCCALGHESLAEELLDEFYNEELLYMKSFESFAQVLNRLGYVRLSKGLPHIPDGIYKKHKGYWPITLEQYTVIYNVCLVASLNPEKELITYCFTIINK